MLSILLSQCKYIAYFSILVIIKPSVTLAQIRDWQESGCMVDGVPTLKCLEVVFGNLLFISSSLVGLVLFIMLVLGSFRYLTSGGNPEKLKKAQGTIMWAVIGLLLFAGAFLILKIIDCLFLGCQNKIFIFEIPEA